MKPSRDIGFSKGDGMCSIIMPKAARAYVPKVNMRRPGNILMFIILVLLLLVLTGLAIADPHGPCSDIKKLSLRKNELDHYSAIAGFKFLGPDEVCTFLEICEEGFPGTLGCMNGTTRPSSVELYVSKTLYEGRQEQIPDSPLFEVCSIHDTKVQDCKMIFSVKEKVLFYMVQGLSSYYLGPHSIMMGPSFSTLDDFNCTGVASPQCEGDEAFKMVFSQAGTDKSCSCTAMPQGHIPYLVIGGKPYRVDYLFYKTLDVQYKIEKEEDATCLGCEVSCNAGQVIVEYDQPMEVIEMCAGSFCMSLLPKPVLHVPLSLAAVSNVFNYFIRFEDGKEKHGVLQCKLEDLCPLIDCHFCIEKLKNPHCYNALDKINFLLIICIWFILLAIVVKILKVATFFTNFLMVVLKFSYKLARWVVKTSLNAVGIKMISINERISRTVELGDGSTMTESRDAIKTKFFRKVQPTYIKTFAIIAVFLIPLVLGCSDSAILDSDKLDCVMEGKELKCSSKSSARITVAPVGQSSCFIFKTPDGLNSGSIEVETSSLSLLCNKEVHYWTYDAEAEMEQQCFCTWSFSGYGNEDKCRKYNENTNCGKPLSCDGLGIHRSYCKTATGGWEETCFSYGSLYCYYSIHFLNKRKTSYEVSSCSSFYWQANLKVRIQTLEKEDSYETKISPGSKFSFTGGTLHLESMSIPPIPVMDSCFVKSKRGTFLADCQKRGGIVAGKIGELQCPSKSAAENPSKSCSISSGVFSAEPLGSRINVMTYLYKPSSLKKKLPILSAGYMIKEVNGVVQARVNHLALMGLRLSLKDMKLQPYSLKSKCSVKFIQAKGCVSCLSGSKLELKVKSEEGDAKALLSCPSLKASIPFKITQKERKIELSVHFENGLINEECLVKCPGNEVTIKIKAELISDVQVSRTFDENFDDIVEVTSNWIKNFFGQFNGFLYYPVIGLIIFGTIGILWFMLCQGRMAYHPKRF